MGRNSFIKKTKTQPIIKKHMASVVVYSAVVASIIFSFTHLKRFNSSIENEIIKMTNEIKQPSSFDIKKAFNVLKNQTEHFNEQRTVLYTLTRSLTLTPHDTKLTNITVSKIKSSITGETKKPLNAFNYQKRIKKSLKTDLISSPTINKTNHGTSYQFRITIKKNEI